MKNPGNKLEKLLGILFLCYWGYTLVTVVFLDRDAVHFKRSYEGSNLLPLAIGILILLLLHWLSGKEIWKKADNMPEGTYYGILLGISFAAFCLQLVCMYKIAKPLAYDFEHLRKNAMSIAWENRVLEPEYFSKCSNNQNILYVFAMLVKMFGDWKAVVFLGVLMVNISVLLAGQISYRITKKKSVGVIVLVIGILLFDFSYRTFVPYTDNYSVLWLMIPLYVYFNQKEGKGWKLLSAASIAAGCFIKITCAILLLAGILTAVLYRVSDKKKVLKDGLRSAVIFACVFIGLTAGKNICLKNAGFVEDTDAKWGVWHYFMMGQNEATLGGGWGRDREYSSGFETLEERNAANRAEGFQRIRNRGIRNNVLFYTYKNFQNYDDGCFSTMQKTIKGEEYGDSLIEKIFIIEKPYYHLYALLEQTMWMLVLTLILYGAIRCPWGNRRLLFLRLVILGVSAYTLLFEGRAKYLFMFVPIYLLLAAEGLGHVMKDRGRSDILRQ